MSKPASHELPIILLISNEDSDGKVNEALSTDNISYQLHTTDFSTIDLNDLLHVDLIVIEETISSCKNLLPLCSSISETEIPFIIVSAFAFQEDRVAGFEAKAVDYITKPFCNGEFVLRVLTQLEIKIQRDKISAINKDITEKKRSIDESIRYAKRIQHALLPPEDYISELLGENFVLYMPKDIVSGDFYWVGQANNSIVIVAADCTGHGIPGAFMSVLGISLLNEFVSRNQITSANILLTKLRKEIKRSLRQRGRSNEARDGMDIAICVLDKEAKKMQYAGANNSLYIVRDNMGEAELIEVKADKMPVGFYPKRDRPFTNHEIELELSDTIYLFSDGFVDQIGGENEKKFKSSNFKDLLLSISDEPLLKQKEILEEKISSWMSSFFQMDDILVVGFRV